MDSGALKTEALCWLRFGKHLDLVCTEGGKWCADVLGVGDTMVVEVEVKTSIADLNREFSTKLAKHALYRAAKTSAMTSSVPNYFYFFVPYSIAERAAEVISEHMPDAGLAVYLENSRERDGKKTAVVRKPKRLHDRPPTKMFRDVVLRRMGSELCGRHVAWQRFVDHGSITADTAELLAKTVSEAIREIPQTPDFDTEET